MSKASENFLAVWYVVMQIGVIFMIASALVVYIVYKWRVSSISDPKQKHDYINLNEVNWYKWVFYLVGVAAFFAVNLYGRNINADIGLWFFVRLFFSICAGTLVAYVVSLILDFYYSNKLSAKLRKLRYTPRINPNTGNKMRLLNEEEDNVYLDEGMIAEENLFSVDYDVWIDDQTGYVKIEKYPGYLLALKCNNCGFYTMRVQREEIVERNDDGSPKELLRHYQCAHCKSVRATQFIISRKDVDDYGNQKHRSAETHRSVETHQNIIDLIKIDIRSNHGATKSFEFSSPQEAQKFLSEFDFNKVV